MSLGIKTVGKILKIRNSLQQISHISFTFSKLNKDFPIDKIDEDQAKELISEYENLIKDTEKIVNLFKKENE